MEKEMRTYVIRRPAGWDTHAAVRNAAVQWQRIGDEEMGEDIRWIRTYVVTEADGSLGTVCIYQASSLAKVHEHARRSGLPTAEILDVVDTVLVRTDPLATTLAA